MENLEIKTENKFDGLFIIGYGLSGGFGGQRNFEVIEVSSQEEADIMAWENACEEYDRYAGSNGLRDVGQIMEEDGIEDEDEAEEAFSEEREGWLDYSAHPYSKEYEKKISGNHYQNDYREITG
jgi:hypothetical protein